jgi:hypothetical protein
MLFVMASAAFFATFAAGACGPPGRGRGALGTSEERLLPRIVAEQEGRVRQAVAVLTEIEDDVRALRLRQRMLLEHGRPDLADALEQEVQDKEAQIKVLRRRVDDAQDALAAYRAFAARAGVALPSHQHDDETGVRTVAAR